MLYKPCASRSLTLIESLVEKLGKWTRKESVAAGFGQGCSHGGGRSTDDTRAGQRESNEVNFIAPAISPMQVGISQRQAKDPNYLDQTQR